jgi:hypothetical protein
MKILHVLLLLEATAQPLASSITKSLLGTSQSGPSSIAMEPIFVDKTLMREQNVVTGQNVSI